MKNRGIINLCKAGIAGLVILLAAFNASAASMAYGFIRVTTNNVEDLSGQLSITLWDSSEANSTFGATLGTALTATQVLFTIENDVGISSNVSEVYFDDGLLGPSVIHNSLGGTTNFTGGGASPGNLPSGNTVSPPFVATEIFSADAQGNPSKGVDASLDILGIVLGLGGYADFAAVLAAVDTGDLRFGLHIRSIGEEGGSDSYVSNTGGSSIPAVPLPAAVWLFGSVLLGFGALKRKA